MIVGLEKTVARRGEFHDDITKLVFGFGDPLAVVDGRGRLLTEPLRENLNMLVPIKGTENSHRAAEVAIAIARVSHAPLTALYVSPGGRNRSRRYEEAIRKAHAAIDFPYDSITEVRRVTGADLRPSRAARRQNPAS